MGRPAKTYRSTFFQKLSSGCRQKSQSKCAEKDGFGRERVVRFCSATIVMRIMESKIKFQSDEYHSFLHTIITTLTPQSKKVFQLCRQQGLSYDEAAENMGVSRSLIKKHMVRSMKIMRLAD